MGIGVLGTLTVDEAPGPLGRRDRVVLSALATRVGHVVSRDALVDALWHEDPPASAPKVVQGCVLRLRRILGPEVIRTAPPGYVLVEGTVDIDARRFEDAVGKARDLLALGQSDRAAHVADEALALWRGRPLPDVEDWEPGVLEASRLEDLRRDAEELRVDCYLRSGRHHDVIADAAALLRQAPTREARWALLARAQYQDGRQTEALATLRQASDLLADRVGIDPGPELVGLRDAMLRQDPDLFPTPQTAHGPATCPYRGLAAYDQADADAFFGRDTDVAACLLLLEQQGVLALVGPSGSGKSSVVRAGVAATLGQQGRRVRVITPGASPVAALVALPRLQRGDVLVVDQCEEVFSLCRDAELREEFLRRLVDHAGSGGSVVVALRADRLAEVTPYPSFARLVERGLHLLGSLDEPALREVIERPARDAGLILEPGLVDLLVSEVLDEPGGLPLLSHALQETWARREGHTLTVAAYRASGGIRGAVAQTAEQVYERVDPSQRHLLRELMLRLVSAGHEGEPSRVRAPRDRVIVEPAQERLVDDLVAARLLTSEEGAIEIAHESLARAWPRLQDWLADDVEGRRILHHVSSAAEAWDSLGRPDSELYRGTRLQQALEWRDSADVELTATERSFLDSGWRVLEEQEREAADRSRRQAILIRRQRVALVAGSVFLVLALAASGVAVSQGSRAQAGEEAADAGRRSALASRLGARALTISDPSLALLLATEAVLQDDDAETRTFLREAMMRRPELVSSTEKIDSFFLNVAANREANDVVAFGYDNKVYRLDLGGEGDVLATWDLDGPGVSRRAVFPPGMLARSPDGEVVAVGQQVFASAPQLTLLDAETLRPLPQQLTGFPELRAKSPGIAFSGDGDWLAATFQMIPDDATQPGTVDIEGQAALIWDLRRPEAPPRRIALPDRNGWVKVQLSKDGRTLFSLGTTMRARPVRPGGDRWNRRDLGPGFGAAIDLSPDGTVLAVPAGADGLHLLDARTGATMARLPLVDPADPRFSPSGDRLASSSWGNELRVWDVESKQQLTSIEVSPGVGVSYDYAESVLHVSGEHGVETLDIEGTRRFMKRTPWPIPPRATADFSFTSVAPGGEFVARHLSLRSTESDLVEVASASGRRRGGATVSRVGGPASTDWNPDGTEYVVGNGRGDVVVIPVRGDVRRFRLPGVDLTAIRFAADGAELLVADDSGDLLVVSATTGRAREMGLALDGVPRDLSVTADGRRAFVALADMPVGPSEVEYPVRWVLVDVPGQQVVESGEFPVDVAFELARVDIDPHDGERVALLGGFGALVLELRTGSLVAPQRALHEDRVLDGGYSVDGSIVVSGAEDGRVYSWDAASGLPVDVAVTDPRFLPSAELVGPHTMVAATSESIYRWDTRIDSAIAAACRAVGRSMTAVEWRTNVGDEVPYRATCG